MKVICDKKDGSSFAAWKWVESPCASCCQGEPGEIEYEYQPMKLFLWLLSRRTRCTQMKLIALFNLSVLAFSFVVFHDKDKGTQQENQVHTDVECYG